MLTKKDLEQKFNLGSNTVYRTLQSCPLGTKKKEYTEEEIEEYFVPARTMLDSGKTYQEVAEYFQNQTGETTEEAEEDDFNAQGFTDNQASDAADAATTATAETVVNLIDQSIDEVAPYVPALVVQALNKEFASGGRIREAFDQMNSQLQKKKGKKTSSGAQMLKDKLQERQNQLPGTQKQNLLESSQENSENNSTQSYES